MEDEAGLYCAGERFCGRRRLAPDELDKLRGRLSGDLRAARIRQLARRAATIVTLGSVGVFLTTGDRPEQEPGLLIVLGLGFAVIPLGLIGALTELIWGRGWGRWALGLGLSSGAWGCVQVAFSGGERPSVWLAFGLMALLGGVASVIQHARLDRRNGPGLRAALVDLAHGEVQLFGPTIEVLPTARFAYRLAEGRPPEWTRVEVVRPASVDAETDEAIEAAATLAATLVRMPGTFRGQGGTLSPSGWSIALGIGVLFSFRRLLMALALRRDAKAARVLVLHPPPGEEPGPSFAECLPDSGLVWREGPRPAAWRKY